MNQVYQQQLLHQQQQAEQLRAMKVSISNFILNAVNWLVFMVCLSDFEIT
jgi:hypothetical protein